MYGDAPCLFVRARRARNDDHHFAFGGEFDRVREKVANTLAQTDGVEGEAGWYIWMDEELQLDTFFAGDTLVQLEHAAQLVAQVARDRRDLQLARFDLGEVQNIVEQHHQRAA